ncbi:hypothetical protein ASF23_05735 [Curtobacterium sp. Leaf261]|nr:hypothetical protein ASF23_05735 [Curtobacterium sp. Leaf261]
MTLDHGELGAVFELETVRNAERSDENSLQEQRARIKLSQELFYMFSLIDLEHITSVADVQQ